MGKASALKWLLLATVVFGGLWYWVEWSFDMHTKVAEQKDTIGERDKTITDLRQQITDYVSGKNKTDQQFKDIDESQVDLICAARNNTPVVPLTPEKPQIVEVVKWRDRTTQCPTTDPEKAEPFDPTTSELRPVNEEIALQSLNNSWKAYCIATKNKDDVCIPFR